MTETAKVAHDMQPLVSATLCDVVGSVGGLRFQVETSAARQLPGS